MTPQILPGRDALKTQAKRLRSTLAQQGTPISHSAALETLASQWGFRDWNTLSAAAETATPVWQVGQAVAGQYLGHDFTGRLKSVRQASGGHWHLTLVFDQPIDVVASERFSALRRQINATVNARGVTHQKTSDGQPHLVLKMT